MLIDMTEPHIYGAEILLKCDDYRLYTFMANEENNIKIGVIGVGSKLQMTQYKYRWANLFLTNILDKFNYTA